MKSLSVVSTLVLAASIAAQGIATFPSDHTTVQNGTTYSGNFPYSFGVSRTMSEYDSWDIGVPNGHQITAIGFRQDGSNASVGHALQLEVRMGTTTSNAANIGTTFDSNYATGPTTVFGPALYTLPTLTSATTASVIWLNLTTPYTYNANQNLLVEWRIVANNNGNASWTYYLDAANYISTVTSGPQGCLHSGNSRSHMFSSSSGTAIGGNWYLYQQQGPASSVGFWLTTVNSALVTPYSLQGLIPGIDSTCMGQLNLSAPLYLNTFTTDTSGNHNWNFTVPNNRLMWNDAIVSSQALVLDFFAPGGMVSSNGDQIQFGIDPANTCIYATGSSTATTGNVLRNYGIVTLFQYN